MQNVQRGYVGSLSQEEVLFYREHHKQVSEFVRANYSKEQIQRIETLVLQKFPELETPTPSNTKIRKAIIGNVMFKVKYQIDFQHKKK